VLPDFPDLGFDLRWCGCCFIGFFVDGFHGWLIFQYVCELDEVDWKDGRALRLFRV